MTAPGGDDIGEKIARLLSSPDGMEKIQSVMAALGGGESSPTPPAPTPLSASPASPTGAASSPDSVGMPDIAALSRMLPLLGSLNKEDNDTRLLQALRPYLHGEREQRLDEAVKLLRLSRMLPLLQAQGLFGSGSGTREGRESHGG